MRIIKLFIGKNKTAFIAAAVIFFAGSVMGAVSSCKMSPSDADELKGYISPYLDTDAASAVKPGAIFAADTANHLKFASAALLCALSIYLVPVFAFVLGLKGYQLGFATGFISANFGIRGTVLALSSTLISYWFAVPLYLLMFVHLLKFSAEMKKRAASMSVRERRGEYMSYFIPVFIACSLLCASAGVGAVLTPLIVDFMN
ncbi:MAG: hypothetical protein IJ460_07075 [Clostridia bacterium]|nr:hypothetical protein [Clostridia bacterium]